jgi:hypothetical protein
MSAKEPCLADGTLCSPVPMAALALAVWARSGSTWARLSMPRRWSRRRAARSRRRSRSQGADGRQTAARRMLRLSYCITPLAVRHSRSAVVSATGTTCAATLSRSHISAGLSRLSQPSRPRSADHRRGTAWRPLRDALTCQYNAPTSVHASAGGRTRLSASRGEVRMRTTRERAAE